MRKVPENIQCDVSGYGCSVSWEWNGARYHMWLTNSSARSDILFKHSLAPRSAPGYFNTRHLKQSAHVKMIAYVLDIVSRERLVEKATIAHEVEEATRVAAQTENARRTKLRQFAPDLLKALRDLTDAVAGCPEALSWARHQYDAALDVLEKAEAAS